MHQTDCEKDSVGKKDRLPLDSGALARPTTYTVIGMKHVGSDK
jgi:hypothetical protein